MKKPSYMGLLHEINSPIASLAAILYTNKTTIPPEVHIKLSKHIDRLIEVASVLSQAENQDIPTIDQIVRLLKIWLELHNTPSQDFQAFTTTYPINGPTSKTDYADLIWDICEQQIKQLGGTLHKTSSQLTLTLPHHLQP